MRCMIYRFFNTYLPEFVYGSIDGVVTTFAIVTASIGAHLSPVYIFILGFANVLADGFSMGSSNYLSALSEMDLQGKGDEGKKLAKKKALVTFLSFVALGSLPVLPFLFSIFFKSFEGIDVILSISLAFFSFIFIGYIGARVTQTSHIKSISRTVFIGGIASLISFLVGYFLQGIGS